MLCNVFFKLLSTALILAPPAASFQNAIPTFGYECVDGKCIRTFFKNEYSTQSFSVCRMLCGSDIGTLWPRPTGAVMTGRVINRIDPQNIHFEISRNNINNTLWNMVQTRFQWLIDIKLSATTEKGKGKKLVIVLDILGSTQSTPMLDYDTDEDYSLKIEQTHEEVRASIVGYTFFGVRHGLETLSQLIVNDEYGDRLQILVNTVITDSPAFKHRGVLLDTARHYFSVNSIKRTLDGMAASKLNTLHWHIVDSNSFPMVLRSHSDLYKLGAYSLREVYTSKDIEEIVFYALARGIRVIPEFDGPAHSGEGWQGKNVTACFQAQPWQNFCSQPPCGHLDPTNPAVYRILEDIYREMFDSFKPNIFHMGGDTVSASCWNSSWSIRNWMIDRGWHLSWNDFIKLWGHFQKNAVDSLDRVSLGKPLPVILWAGPLASVPFIDSYLEKDRYIIQTVWDESDRNTEQVLSRGFKMIVSTFDIFIKSDTANWNGGREGGWQTFYKHQPDRNLGQYKSQILGSEAAAWSEQIDELTLDNLLWPKASALAERLWSNPSSNWRSAESRILIHRESLAAMGLTPEALQPEWCLLNENECPKQQ